MSEHAVELSSDHIEALDSCYSEPLPVADIGSDADWWQLFYDLRDIGYVAFGDDSVAVEATAAGRAWLDARSAEEEEVDETPDPAAGYDSDYSSFLDTFYDEPVPADEVAEWWLDVQQMIGNGHLAGPDGEGYLHITDAGKALFG